MAPTQAARRREVKNRRKGWSLSGTMLSEKTKLRRGCKSGSYGSEVDGPGPSAFCSHVFRLSLISPDSDGPTSTRLSSSPARMPSIYPAFATNKSGCLKVDHVHDVYWEECGNPDGLPVIYVHGGPGGGIDDDDRRYFDPSVYRSVLFDQRGCGRSTPAAELTDNTTWHLVSDMEKLRESLAIEKWVVFGGSWGDFAAKLYWFVADI